MSTTTPPATNEWADPAGSRQAKALVMAELRRIAETGGAVMQLLDGDVVELRLLTGEIFHLRGDHIARLI